MTDWALAGLVKMVTGEVGLRTDGELEVRVSPRLTVRRFAGGGGPLQRFVKAASKNRQQIYG